MAIEVGGSGAPRMRLPAQFRPGANAEDGLLWGSTGGAGARLATIAVVRVRRRKVLLRAPLVTAWAADPRFTEKASQLRQFARQYTGHAEYSATPPPASGSRRPV